MSKTYEIRLGKKGKKFSFNRTELGKDGRTVIVGKVKLNQLTPSAPITLEEVARLRGAFEMRRLELFEEDGTPTTITDVLDKGVPPELTDKILAGYDKPRLLELANELEVETSFKPDHDDKVQGLSTFELRKAILEATQGKKYKALLKKRDERILKERAEREEAEMAKAEEEALARKKAEEEAEAVEAEKAGEPEEFKEPVLMKKKYEDLADMVMDRGIPKEDIALYQKSDLVHYIRVHEGLEDLIEGEKDYRQG